MIGHGYVNILTRFRLRNSIDFHMCCNYFQHLHWLHS